MPPACDGPHRKRSQHQPDSCLVVLGCTDGQEGDRLGGCERREPQHDHDLDASSSGRERPERDRSKHGRRHRERRELHVQQRRECPHGHPTAVVGAHGQVCPVATAPRPLRGPVQQIGRHGRVNLSVQ